MEVIQKLDQATVTDTPKVKRRSKEKITKIVEGATAGNDDAEVGTKKVPRIQLKKKLTDLSAENQNLSQAISAKNAEISDLKRSVQSLNEVLNSVPIDELRCNSSIASSKLLELSKKNRQLRAELETTKNRVNKKEMQIQKLERELKHVEDRAHNAAAETHKDASDELRAKLTALQQKLFETRNKNSELQGQLKLAQKCLQQEIGEHFNLATMAAQAQNSNWRGRAQQILHLQQKLHELKERLDIVDRHSMDGRPIPYGSDGITQSESTPTSAAKSVGGRPGRYEDAKIATNASATSFDRYNTVVRKTEILHRAKVEGLEKEIVALRGQLEEQRGKVLALKVRNKTLNDDVLKFKIKANSLEEQTDYNGLNLANMNEKMNVQRYHYENRLEEMTRQLNDLKRIHKDGEFREEELRVRLENMENLVQGKDTHIEELNQNIARLETDLKALAGGFLFSCRELRKEEFITILDALEAEKNHLLEHNKTLIARSEQDRIKNEALHEQVAKQKGRISRLESRIRELEKELEMQSERKKRTQRIADYVNSVSSSVSSMGTFVFESSSLNNLSHAAVEEMTQAQIYQMKHELEYAKEKLIYLTEKVLHLQEEKENDARAFADIINSSKSAVLDTILNNRSSASLSVEINAGESL
ncbi:coiled-coil domain-containing protein 13-like [Rhagoletis pomonella]|uniref:coiled-coil domain-containing protein 13-like n=1 Tax=Rhagoletis pomonella TaxID=28610 RepID=UPI00177F928A|nr:coiled-coil domain-containing protein 13-like [Rhagoletis pomonella]